VEAIILIDAPAEKVWPIMTDCEAAPKFVPGLAACQVLHSGQDWEIIQHDVKWTWLLPEVSYVFLEEYEKNKRIDFERIRGGLRDIRGSWRLVPLNDGKANRAGLWRLPRPRFLRSAVACAAFAQGRPSGCAERSSNSGRE
jgi:ribosome-associated toxin RatA of RatAB toxin-antitoxin module